VVVGPAESLLDRIVQRGEVLVPRDAALSGASLTSSQSSTRVSTYPTVFDRTDDSRVALRRRTG
jgi:hypothetical protein